MLQIFIWEILQIYSRQPAMNLIDLSKILELHEQSLHPGHEEIGSPSVVALQRSQIWAEPELGLSQEKVPGYRERAQTW